MFNSTADRGRLRWQHLRRQADFTELEQSTGQAATVVVHTSALCHVCAMSLLDAARDSQSHRSQMQHLALRADASAAQSSTALQTLGGYAGNT